MKHYVANFKEELVADLYFQRPIEKWRHTINDIKGDFMKRLETDQVFYTKITEIEDITGKFIVGFFAFTSTPSNGYVIKEDVK